MKNIILLLVLSLSLSPLLAQEKGYKVVRPDGSVEFTDKPVPGAKEIKLPKAQAYEAPSSPAPATTPQSSAAAPAYDYQLTITSPQDDQTYQPGEEVVQISVDLQPGLQGGHTLVILLDGSVVAENKSTLNLANVERGSHSVTAEVRDESGNAVVTAGPVTFHRRQSSLLQPGRAAPVPPPPPPAAPNL